MNSRQKRPPPRVGASMVPFSFSRLKDYERCAFYAYEVHVKKNRGPQSPASARGEKIHKVAEDTVNLAKTTPLSTKVKLDVSLRIYEQQFDEVRQRARSGESIVHAEMEFGVTRDWLPVGWFEPTTWGRGKWDLVELAPDRLRVVDYKTGRVYPETADQLRFYAVAAIAYTPEAPKVVAEAWHLDQTLRSGHQVFELLPREIGLVRRDFERRVAKMEADTELRPTPNSRCVYCHLSKTKGGPCPAA